MESAPKRETQMDDETIPAETAVESFSNWRELKELAPDMANKIVASIEGFEEKEPSEQIAALEEKLQTLSKDNKNRFVADVIAHRISFTKEVARHKEEMERLGVAA